MEGSHPMRSPHPSPLAIDENIELPDQDGRGWIFKAY
jgi:hypothetical protein